MIGEIPYFAVSITDRPANVGVNRDWLTNSFDLDGRSRLDKFSGIVDMGCYEYLFSGSIYRVGF